MLFFKVLTSFCLAALATARAAPVSRDSPRGAMYEATFTQHGNVRGSIRFYTQNGYVRYYINVNGLPARGGPFMYHVHQRRVPASGDCVATLGHFNPYNGVLNAPTPAEYEVGDLSGKHGMISGTRYRRVFDEVFASLNPRNMAFIGDLSVVIHLHDGTRIACANLRRISAAALQQGPEDMQGGEGEGEGEGAGAGAGAGMQHGHAGNFTEGPGAANFTQGSGAPLNFTHADDGADNSARNDSMRLDGSRLSKFVT